MNTVEFNGVEITDRHEVAEAFNTHFTEVGENLTNNIPKTDVNPTSYIKPTNSVFSFKMTDVNYVKDLLREIYTKKSSGPENIPKKLLKIAMNVVASSLTHIFNNHFVPVSTQRIGKLPMLHLSTKMVLNATLIIIAQFQ